MAESTYIGSAAALITEHLKNRQIYQIFQHSNEKDNITAVQFMCIVDFHAMGMKLFERIKETNQPKLLGQLLQFRQYEKFRYFHYPVSKQYGNYVLQCTYCELVGPCGCILTHLTISHNVHTGLKTCIFCKLEPHIDNVSLAQCHANYIHRYSIEVDRNVCGIVVDFYETLKKLSENLNICSTRRRDYAGKGRRCIEKLKRPQDYGGDISPECEVRYMIPKKQINRSIQSEALTREFLRVMDISCGGNYYATLSRLNRPPAGDSIVIDDSDCSGDDADVNNVPQIKNAVGSSRYCGTVNEQQYQNTHNLPDGISPDDIPENLVKSEPRFNDSPTPSMSSYAVPMASTSTRIDRRFSTFSSVSRPCSDWTPRNESEEFALSIARKLEKIPPEKRRQLEIDIEVKILQTEKEAIHEGCQSFVEHLDYEGNQHN